MKCDSLAGLFQTTYIVNFIVGGVSIIDSNDISLLKVVFFQPMESMINKHAFM